MPKRRFTYYEEINRAITSYEEHKSWHEKTIDWICDRITWCNKWRKITKEETDELAERIIKVMEGIK